LPEFALETKKVMSDFVIIEPQAARLNAAQAARQRARFERRMVNSLFFETDRMPLPMAAIDAG